MITESRKRENEESLIEEEKLVDISDSIAFMSPPKGASRKLASAFSDLEANQHRQEMPLVMRVMEDVFISSNEWL